MEEKKDEELMLGEEEENEGLGERQGGGEYG